MNRIWEDWTRILRNANVSGKASDERSDGQVILDNLQHYDYGGIWGYLISVNKLIIFSCLVSRIHLTTAAKAHAVALHTKRAEIPSQSKTWSLNGLKSSGTLRASSKKHSKCIALLELNRTVTSDFLSDVVSTRKPTSWTGRNDLARIGCMGLLKLCYWIILRNTTDLDINIIFLYISASSSYCCLYEHFWNEFRINSDVIKAHDPLTHSMTCSRVGWGKFPLASKWLFAHFI